MEEAENQNSQEEVVPPAAETKQEAPNEIQEQKEVQAEDSEWIKNLRKDRKEALRRAEEAERKSRMQEELLQKFMAQPQTSQPAPAAEEDFLSEIAKAEYVEGEKVAKGFKKLEEKFNKRVQDIERQYEERQKLSRFNELKVKYPDFDEVVNPETIAIFEETDLDLAKSIASNPDPRAVALQTYTYIKSSGIHKKLQPSKRALETEQKIEQNKKTVQSPQAFDKRPMAAAFKMSKDYLKEVQREMYECAQQAGMGY